MFKEKKILSFIFLLILPSFKQQTCGEGAGLLSDFTGLF